MMRQNSYKLQALSFAVYVAIGIMLLLFHARTSMAQNPVQPDTDSAAWQIQADQLRFDQTRDEYFAQGNVIISRDQYTLTADQVRLNQTTREAVAVGHIRLVSGRDILTGDRLFFNLDNKTGILQDGTLFSSESNLYISGERIEKTGPASYHAEQAKVTSCEGDDPDWHITSSDVKVTVEGYGLARNVAFYAKRIPLLYTPFLAFPVKTKRQSGLLTPDFASSDRKGSQYLQPLYWAIDPSSDATFFAHYMSERGTRMGMEYRYILEENSLGVLMVEGLDDRRVDDGQADNSKRWGYTDDNSLRPNHDRYWFRAKVNQDLPWDATAKLDLDIVSDQDYLQEFKSTLYGYEYTSGYFLETFGRDVDDYTDPVRLNRLNISRNWTNYVLNADLRWQDNVIARRQLETDTTLQQLPLIALDGIKQPLAGSNFYYDLTSSAVNFYREDGDQGRRLDVYPRLYYLFTMFGGLSIEPSAGLRQTAWHLDRQNISTQSHDDTEYRMIYDFRLDTSTGFYRIYDFRLAGSDRMKHIIQPTIEYEYIPDQDQTDWPKFDSLDRIEHKNSITYSIVNNFTARRPATRKDGPTYAYINFLRLELLQSYDFTQEDEEEGRPFSDISAELDFTPGQYVSIDADAAWSPYDSEFTSYNVLLSLWDARGDRLNVDYRYTRKPEDAAQDTIKSISLSGQMVLNNRWLARGSYEYNFYTNETIASQIGLKYQSQCWAVDLDYRTEEDDRSITAMLTLLGLGSIGSR